MAKYIIIEDERLAYEEIRRMMQRLRPDYMLAGWAASVEQAVLQLASGGIDLMIVDIRLSDGLSFEIFERTAADIPVIFTTAYDEYALRAFKVNSIDYLLKPVEEQALETALCKFERNCLPRTATPELKRLEATYMTGIRKNRFLVRSGDTFRYVKTSDIAFFLQRGEICLSAPVFLTSLHCRLYVGTVGDDAGRSPLLSGGTQLYRQYPGRREGLPLFRWAAENILFTGMSSRSHCQPRPHGAGLEMDRRHPVNAEEGAMKKKTILFFVLLIAVSLLLFIQTFSSLVHTPERTGTAGLWVNFFVNLPCCILIGYADYRVAKSLQKRFPDRNIIRIALSILLTALPVGLLAVVANYAAARLYAHPFSIAGSVFPIVLWNSLIVLFIELFFYNRRQIEQQRRLAVMEKEKALFQFEALKNQINPPFSVQQPQCPGIARLRRCGKDQPFRQEALRRLPLPANDPRQAACHGRRRAGFRRILSLSGAYSFRRCLANRNRRLREVARPADRSGQCADVGGECVETQHNHARNAIDRTDCGRPGGYCRNQ